MDMMKRCITVLVILVWSTHPLCAQETMNLRITELMFNPADDPNDASVDNDLFEFVELKNVGEVDLDLSQVAFTHGIDFEFKGSEITSLAPGEFVLVVQDAKAFVIRYGMDLLDRVAGSYTGKLSNGGERVTVEDRVLGTIIDFEYGDGRGWPLGTDGTGHSLVPLADALMQSSPSTLNYAGNWRSSTYLGGSPGMDDPTIVPTLVLNELLANPIADQTDFVELYNRSEDPINLTGWYLSDDLEDLSKWPLTGQTILPGLSRISIDLAHANFSLNSRGEELVLSYLLEGESGGMRDAVAFKAQEPGMALGRYADGNDGWFRLEPSRDRANTPPMNHLMLSEIMYHPLDPNLEYIEIVNTTDQAVELGSLQALWRLDGDVEFVFPVGTVIQPNERMVILGFDPVVDTDQYVAFRAAYGLDASTPMPLGPWSGKLANSGERIALEQALDVTDVNDLAWVLVDEVVYSDQYPWPSSADGQGDALGRVNLNALYDSMDPASWQAVLPSPGTE